MFGCMYVHMRSHIHSNCHTAYKHAKVHVPLEARILLKLAIIDLQAAEHEQDLAIGQREKKERLQKGLFTEAPSRKTFF